ncbi:hypothetical protein AOX61_24155 [Pseudomonas aeruginosa]|nr:hypothetical protein AOX61_24155 [Pseudomonas aeruginosa]
MRALAGLLCGLLGLVSGAAAYEPDVFGTAGQVAGQAVYDLGGSGLPCRGGPPPTELSLEEAIERILCHDPQTRLAWANAKAQAAQAGIGKSAYLPRLDGRLDASRGYSDMDYRDAPYLSGDGHRHRRGASLQFALLTRWRPEPRDLCPPRKSPARWPGSFAAGRPQSATWITTQPRFGQVSM